MEKNPVAFHQPKLWHGSAWASEATSGALPAGVRGALLEAGTRQSPRPGLRLRLSQGAKPALFTKEETEAQRAMIYTLSSHAPRRTRKMGDLREAVAEGRGAQCRAPRRAPRRAATGPRSYFTLHFALTLTFTLLD